MPHIPEGRLHAWLDGAAHFESASDEDSFRMHLATCEDCRVRLEEARHLRSEASSILAETGPVRISRPPFETLKARAETRAAGPAAVSDSGRGRKGDKRSALFPRRIPLAWAASIVVAIGAGWLGREMLDAPARQELSAPGTVMALRSEAEEALPERDLPISRMNEAVGDLLESDELRTDADDAPAAGEKVERQPNPQREPLVGADEEAAKAVSPEPDLARNKRARDRLEMLAAENPAGQPGVEQNRQAAGRVAAELQKSEARAQAGERGLADVSGAAAPGAVSAAEPSERVAIAGCYGLETSWAAPFTLPDHLRLSPADADLEQKAETFIMWRVEMDDLHIHWRSGELHMIVVIPGVKDTRGGTLEGTATAWSEAALGQMAGGRISLSRMACPQKSIKTIKTKGR